MNGANNIRYIENEPVLPKALADLRESVGWNRMISILKERHIYMISVVFEEALKPFYDKFGFFHMLSGQIQTYECE